MPAVLSQDCGISEQPHHRGISIQGERKGRNTKELPISPSFFLFFLFGNWIRETVGFPSPIEFNSPSNLGFFFSIGTIITSRRDEKGIIECTAFRISSRERRQTRRILPSGKVTGFP